MRQIIVSISRALKDPCAIWLSAVLYHKPTAAMLMQLQSSTSRISCLSACSGSLVESSFLVKSHTRLLHSLKSIQILALESSADDTCSAIVGSDRKIHANIVIRQQDLLGGPWRIFNA